MKLVPEKNAVIFRGKPSSSVIFKKPHPGIRSIQFSSFKETSLLQTKLTLIEKQLTKRFNQYLVNAGSKQNMTYFSANPSINVFRADASQKLYISISWQGKEDEMFFISGLFEGKEKNGVIELDQIISFADGENIGEFAPTEMITINGRIFVLIDCKGWEGHYSRVYEIFPDQPKWILYMKSEGEYC